MEGNKIPQVTFKCRVDSDWQDVTTQDLFAGKKVGIFSLPGAFTPTCSSTHLPGYEAYYDALQSAGLDEIYCVSVNDAFVMNAWCKDQDIQKVKVIPDGNLEFTEGMGMATTFKNRGFGQRSWRYSAVINDGVVEKMWVEPGLTEDSGPDPFEVSNAETMLEYLNS
jgi:peroxiredoxin|tara:strand:+ start:517 stop:1014 length:498 start_codon:yes stop_codon:yes gene_type:complete